MFFLIKNWLLIFALYTTSEKKNDRILRDMGSNLAHLIYTKFCEYVIQNNACKAICRKSLVK